MAESKQANALATVDEGVKGALLAVNSKGISEFMAELQNVTCFADIVDKIRETAYEGREAWVRTALLIHKGFDGCTRSESAKQVEKFIDKLGYKKSHIYNLRSAGDKLIRMALDNKGKPFDIPVNLTDFLNMGKEKKETPKAEIREVKKIGSYKTANEYGIYRGQLYEDGVTTKDGKAKAKEVFFTCQDPISENATINRTTAFVKNKDGKEVEETTYICGTKDIEVDGKKVTRPNEITLKFYAF